MRHVHGKTDRVVAGFTEPQFEQRGRAARHLHAIEERLVAGDQFWPGRVRREAEWPGMGHRHWNTVKPDRDPHVEPLHQPEHCGEETLPFVVRFWSCE